MFQPRYRLGVLRSSAALICLLFLLSACGSSTDLTADSATPTPGPVLSVHIHFDTTPTPGLTGDLYVDAPPKDLPNRFSFGILDAQKATNQLAELQAESGLELSYRSLYLSQSDVDQNEQALNFVKNVQSPNTIPVIVYEQICASDTPSHSLCTDSEKSSLVDQRLTDAAYIDQYLSRLEKLILDLGQLQRPILLIPEPFLWSYLERTRVADPDNIFVAGKADTLQGFAKNILHARSQSAPRLLLALHASTAISNNDVSQMPNDQLNSLSIKQAAFLQALDLPSWDLLTNDLALHDAAQDNHWWQESQFRQYFTYLGNLSQLTHKRLLLWSIPLGNQYFTTMNNTPGHFQDNRADFLLRNAAELADLGLIGGIFGLSDPQSTSYLDAQADGITNAAPIQTPNCSGCNTHTSRYNDDDGGFLRLFLKQYQLQPVKIW